MPFPISHEEIKKTEAKTGCIFPVGFKARMMANNGGEVEAGDDDWNLIPFLDASDRKKLARTCNDIVRETAKMREWRGFPDDACAVGQNGGGDYLILLPVEEGSKELGENIFWWDHETGEVCKLAESIQDI